MDAGPAYASLIVSMSIDVLNGLQGKPPRTGKKQEERQDASGGVDSAQPSTRAPSTQRGQKQPFYSQHRPETLLLELEWIAEDPDTQAGSSQAREPTAATRYATCLACLEQIAAQASQPAAPGGSPGAVQLLTSPAQTGGQQRAASAPGRAGAASASAPSPAPATPTLQLRIPFPRMKAVAQAAQQVLLQAYPQQPSASQLAMLARVKDQRLRAALPAAIPRPAHDPNRHEGVAELLEHVVGDPAAGMPGAAGSLRFIHSIQWQPYSSSNPADSGHLQLVLTDGTGLYMVVVLRDLWLVGGPRQRRKPRGAASRFERKKADRRARRGRVMRAALAAGRQFEDDLQQRGAGGVVFTGMCVSLAEGLEVVSQRGGWVKRHEETLVCTLVPNIRLGSPAGSGAGFDFSSLHSWSGVLGRGAARAMREPDWQTWALVGGLVVAAGIALWYTSARGRGLGRGLLSLRQGIV